MVSISLINFNVDLNENINTEYKFKDWQYVIAQIYLLSENKLNFNCVDFEAKITLIDDVFFKKKITNVFIKIMITSISVRKLKTIEHITNKYALLFMYFLKINSIDVLIKAKIIRKIYLINELKTNLFLNNDIFYFEKNNIFNSTRITHIDNCDVIISIINWTEEKLQIKTVYTIKAFTLFFKTECLISIYNMSFLFNRNFFFELVDTNFVIFAHLINFNTSFILVRNDPEQFMKIFRNFKLKTIKSFDYSSVYQVDLTNMFDLAIRQFKSEHQISWFRKIIAAFVTITTVCHNVTFISSNNNNSKKSLAKNLEKILTNEIIMYNSFDSIV